MDYEKAYKAVLQTATQWIKDGCTDKEKICLECVFPELRGNEDERIRKELVALFLEVRNREGDEGYWHDLKVADILAYLEKQKEQKPAESIVDRRQIAFMIEDARRCGVIEGRKQVLDNPGNYGLQELED